MYILSDRFKRVEIYDLFDGMTAFFEKRLVCDNAERLVAVAYRAKAAVAVVKAVVVRFEKIVYPAALEVIAVIVSVLHALRV